MPNAPSDLSMWRCVSCGHWRLAVKVQRFGIECMKAWGDSEGYDQVDGFDPKRLVILVVRNEQ